MPRKGCAPARYAKRTDETLSAEDWVAIEVLKWSPRVRELLSRLKSCNEWIRPEKPTICFTINNRLRAAKLPYRVITRGKGHITLQEFRMCKVRFDVSGSPSSNEETLSSQKTKMTGKWGIEVQYEIRFGKRSFYPTEFFGPWDNRAEAQRIADKILGGTDKGLLTAYTAPVLNAAVIPVKMDENDKMFVQVKKQGPYPAL